MSMALAGDNCVLGVGDSSSTVHTYRRLIIELFFFIVLAGDNCVLAVGDSFYAYQRFYEILEPEP